MITIKNEKEIKILEIGGKILGTILAKLGNSVRVGTRVGDLEDLAEKLILEAGGLPSFKNYGDDDPYPCTLCASINDGVVHCIPDDTILKDGDIIGLDIGMKHPRTDDGLYTDCAITVPVGNISKEAGELMDVTKGALNKAISIIKPGVYVNEIGGAIEDYVNSRGKYGIVKELVGHGVGYAVHEAPHIPNYRVGFKGEMLKAGMVLAIEPMINLGASAIKSDNSGWNIKTQDGSLSAHFEHTIVVTDNGCKILTQA